MARIITRFIRHDVSPRARNTEHLAVHCRHGIRPDAALRHALLLTFSEKHKKMSMSSQGQNMVVAAQKLDYHQISAADDSSASSRARLAADQGSAFAVLFTNATCKNVTVTFMITFIYSLRGGADKQLQKLVVCKRFAKRCKRTVNDSCLHG